MHQRRLGTRLDLKHRTTANLIDLVSPGSAIYEHHAKADAYRALVSKR